ncbi:serine hydrolase [Streptomyces sp. 900105755]
MVRTAHGDVRSVEEASVAGESPDRSKQRESSAEPTPGSGESVPEARDPRLAVAAGKETAGGVDTATRIFSVRGLKTDETDETDEPGETGKDDAKLRDAVAAWVRTGEPAEDTEDATAPEAATEAGDGPEAPAGTGRAQRAQEPPESADRAATAPEATTEDTPAAPENAAEPQDATLRHESAPEDKPATAEAPEAKPADKSAPATEPEDAAPQDDPAPPEKPQAAKPQGKSATTAAPAPEDKPKGKPATTADPAPEDKPKGKPATTADPAPEDKPKGKSATTADPEDTAPEDKPKATAEPEDAKPQDKPATTADPEDAAPEDATPEDKPEAAEEPEDGAPAGESEGDAEPEDAVPAERTGAGGEPADADGEDGPQGPPAPGDDGRTGGAGGKTGGGEGEAEPAVDQPTTMLKAPRPPQVDQPTTTLKLGGGTTEAERTSKFVALKSDIMQGPKPAAEPDAKPEPASTTRTTVLPQVGPERTTQQPLPPKPPLDLLAELTNTPPPPETPVRTLFRRVKIWTPLVIVLLIVFAVVQTLRPLPQPTLDLTAKDTYTFDGSRTDMPWPADGQAALDVQGIGTFGSSGDQKPVPIASVAKVMTAYIVLRDHPLKSGAAGPKIKIDQAAQDQANAGQESTVDVTAGDSITQREALESILIASANNVARLLARWDAGSEKSFVAKMNATAKQLGMTNTTYTDPSGLTNSTVSTAVDQVKLAKAAMASEPSFREVAAMMSYDDYKGVNHGNWNQLVGRNNVVGIKTGTTTSALGNLVFAAKKDVNGETRTIIGAVIRQPASAAPDKSILTAALNAGDKLIRAAQGALKSATIYKKGDVVGYVDDGLGGRTPVVATEDVTAVGWSGLKVKLSFAADAVPHTAKAGTKVGTLTVGDGSGSAVQVPVALAKDLAEPGFTSRLTHLG